MLQCVTSFSRLFCFISVAFANALAGHSEKFAGCPILPRGIGLTQPGREVGGTGGGCKVFILVIAFFPASQRVTTGYSNSVNIILIMNFSKCVVSFS